MSDPFAMTAFINCRAESATLDWVTFDCLVLGWLALGCSEAGGRGRADCDFGFDFSRLATRRTSEPAWVAISRSQSLNPALVILTLCFPGGSFNVAGALPINSPSA